MDNLKEYFTNKLTLFILCIFLSFPAYTQALKNTVSLTCAKIWFPDWKAYTLETGISYSYGFNETWNISGSVTLIVSGKDIEFLPSDTNIYEIIYYNEIWYRNLIITDLNIGHKIWSNKVKSFFITAKVGTSFIYGEEVIIKSVWYGPPFHEADLGGNERHHFGINGGVEFLYYPLKHIGIGLFSTGHIYTKYDPDLSVGASLNFRFGK